MFAAGYILLTAKGCEPENEPASKGAAKEEVLIRRWEAAFDTASLGTGQQLALTEQGVHKLEDFMDYLKLVGNKNLDAAFRAQAKTTAGSLFHSGLVYIGLPVSNITAAKPKSLPEFFTELELSPYSSVNYVISNATAEKPLFRSTDTLYTGSVKGWLLVSGISEKDSVVIYQGQVNAEIMAMRSPKKFGNKKTRHVWQVFLGNIRAGK
jgi:hypothetical protein